MLAFCLGLFRFFVFPLFCFLFFRELRRMDMDMALNMDFKAGSFPNGRGRGLAE